jgi:8-oxo-dGTP diphosphatase
MTIPATPKKQRIGASLNVYLILRKGSEVLLHLRKNTGYCDGFYGLVSGHVEEGESAVAAMIREAEEEAGIQIAPHHLKMVHAMHRQTNRNNLDLFFECTEWKGPIINQEADKCASLDFFPAQTLPSNTIDYIADAIKAAPAGHFYSEQGWIS